MAELERGEEIGPEFFCATNIPEEPDNIDKLILRNQEHYNRGDYRRILSVETSMDNRMQEVWLDRGQVQDLMVVLGYWLKQTEGEDDGT